MLGVTRLAFIDLVNGDQPIHNEDSTLWIVFNGEFYNYRPWMKRLAELGHTFYTKSDTETLLHLYEEYGPDCLSKIRGMFAFAIWNSKERSLLLARDRFGVKPLYYYRADDRLIFASEMKAFLKRIPKQLDLRGLEFYLRLRYLPGEMTLIDNVKKLPASCYAQIDRTGIRIKEYYSIPTQTLEPYTDPSATVTRLLSESVRLRLVSDVPLGVFLSGGLDSSSIVALMKRQGIEGINTFSIGFNDQDFDELTAAKEVSSYFETNHHEISIDVSDAIGVLRSVIYHLDEPLADPATIPTFFLAKEAHKYVKGVLLGEGADEVFGGYEHYGMLRLIQRAESLRMKKIARGLLRVTPAIVGNRVIKYSSLLGQEGRNRAERAVESKSATRSGLELVSIFDDDEYESATGTKSTGRVETYAESDLFEKDPVKGFQYFDMNNFLQHLLLRADKMTMAHSLEAREPFLDHVLVEFAFSLPRNSGGYFHGKKLLRKAVSDLLPPEVAYRKKNRFFVPIHSWFESELGQIFWQKMDTPRLDLYSRPYLERLRSRYPQSPLYFARQMWSMLNLELWFETFFPEAEVAEPLRMRSLSETASAETTPVLTLER